MSELYDKGSAIVIEVEFKKQEPFVDTPTYFNPTSPLITVTDKAGTVQVDAQALVSSTTGKYYYKCQTAVSWASGPCEVKVTGVSGSDSDITVDPKNFSLK